MGTMLNIAPLSREKLKTLRSLASTRIRKRKGVCLVEGERALGEAARSRNLLYLVLSMNRIEEAGRTAAERFPDTPVYTLDGGYFAELSDIGSGPGILGAARIPPGGEPGDLLKGAIPPLMVYLDGLREPGNVGGIVRTSWALGISGLILGDGTADPFSAKAIRASAGGVFHLPVYSDVENRDLVALEERGYSIFLAEAGGMDLERVRFPSRSILVLGSETSGFSEKTRKMGQTVGISMASGVDSLNVVVAGSIILEKMRKTS